MDFGHLQSSALDQELGTDDSTRLFLTERRRRALNTAQLHFCDLTECAVDESTFSCSNGDREYNLISTVNVPRGDYLRMSKQGPEYYLVTSGGASSNSTRYISGINFPRRDIAWLNQYDNGWRSTTPADPTFYYERMAAGRRLMGLSPPPRIKSSEKGYVILPYVAKPSSMVVSTSIPFTFGSTVRDDLEPYHQALVHYAASELEKLRLNQPAVQTQLQLFMGYVERFLRSFQPRGLVQVRFARNYWREAQNHGREQEREIQYPWRL